jgi:Na+:H+ antiporter, NhaA family
MSSNPLDVPPLPPRPVQRLTRPFVRFLHIESASGVVLIACTAIALVAANGALAADYAAFWETIVRVGAGDYELAYPLWYWVNDGLMTIFFFVIGLEIKREMVSGELREPRRVILPVAAAIGGAAIPAAIYVSMQWNQPGINGWAIPMATDIAFVVGCLALLGSRVPHGLKILLLSLAIVDDIIAVLVIAIFYSHGFSGTWLAAAGIGFALVVMANRIGIRTVPIYVFIGAGIWLCTLKSGIHPTVAGVALGLLTPPSAFLGGRSLMDVLRVAVRRSDEEAGRPAPRAVLEQVHFAAREAVSPLERLEVALHPWVAFIIMPVFALANAGVAINAGVLGDPVAMAVAVGLVVGKPLGILTATAIVVGLKMTRLPSGVSWLMLAGGSCLAGIGFTMSLFVASLGMSGELLTAAKTGVLMGSGVSATLGFILLGWGLRRASLRQPA